MGLIPLNTSVQLMLEQEERVDVTKDEASRANKFTTKPQGILVQDSYNNPFFPVRPRPRVDTAKLDLAPLFRRYRELYLRRNSFFLPWHYCIEMVDDRYYVFNTRPLDMKFPITNNDAKKRKQSENWDNITQLFFEENIFDISEAIHVCIVGDSNVDVYTNKTYELIGRTCVVPVLRMYRLPFGLYQRTFALNLGKRFNMDLMSKFVKK